MKKILVLVISFVGILISCNSQYSDFNALIGPTWSNNVIDIDWGTPIPADRFRYVFNEDGTIIILNTLTNVENTLTWEYLENGQILIKDDFPFNHPQGTVYSFEVEGDTLTLIRELNIQDVVGRDELILVRFRE